MNIVIFGASGKTGVEIVTQGLEQGHQVTAFVRDPAKLALSHERLRFVTGDVLKPDSITAALEGQQAVIVTLGSQSLGKTTVRSEGTHNIIKAMRQHNLSRLVVVTALGCHESWQQLSWLAKAFFLLVLSNAKRDHEAQEDAVRASGLDWTIVRPSGLTDAPRSGNYRAAADTSLKAGRIARADVADYILKHLDDGSLIGKAVAVT
jgi:putative NADH-flavin reductase